jgi:hypothetical protein
MELAFGCWRKFWPILEVVDTFLESFVEAEDCNWLWRLSHWHLWTFALSNQRPRIFDFWQILRISSGRLWLLSSKNLSAWAFVIFLLRVSVKFSLRAMAWRLYFQINLDLWRLSSCLSFGRCLPYSLWRPRKYFSWLIVVWRQWFLSTMTQINRAGSPTFQTWISNCSFSFLDFAFQTDRSGWLAFIQFVSYLKIHLEALEIYWSYFWSSFFESYRGFESCLVSMAFCYYSLRLIYF